MKSIGLKFFMNDLYPPFIRESDAAVFAASEPAEFRFNLNGVSGDVPGITLKLNSVGGTVTLTREFLAHYSGSWPARYEVQAYQDGQLVDSATLFLHDTGSMIVSRATVGLVLNPANVPFAEDLLIRALASFFDPNEVKLPSEEVAWQLLVPPVTGVTVEADFIRVTPDAAEGSVNVTLREKSGVTAHEELVLLPEYNIGLSLEPADFYPPFRDENEHTVKCIAELEWVDPDVIYSLNGEGGPFTGFYLADSVFRIDNSFIQNYQGSWPVEVRALARRNGQVIGVASGWLHDTRKVVVEKVDVVPTPGDRIAIPAEGEADVIFFAGPRFYDKDGIPISHIELVWNAHMVDKMEGVRHERQVFYVTSDAKPGTYRVGISARRDRNEDKPDDPNRAKPVTLYRD